MGNPIEDTKVLEGQKEETSNGSTRLPFVEQTDSRLLGEGPLSSSGSTTPSSTLSDSNNSTHSASFSSSNSATGSDTEEVGFDFGQMRVSVSLVNNYNGVSKAGSENNVVPTMEVFIRNSQHVIDNNETEVVIRNPEDNVITNHPTLTTEEHQYDRPIASGTISSIIRKVQEHVKFDLSNYTGITKSVLSPAFTKTEHIRPEGSVKDSLLYYKNNKIYAHFPSDIDQKKTAKGSANFARDFDGMGMLVVDNTAHIPILNDAGYAQEVSTSITENTKFQPFVVMREQHHGTLVKYIFNSVSREEQTKRADTGLQFNSSILLMRFTEIDFEGEGQKEPCCITVEHHLRFYPIGGSPSYPISLDKPVITVYRADDEGIYIDQIIADPSNRIAEFIKLEVTPQETTVKAIRHQLLEDKLGLPLTETQKFAHDKLVGAAYKENDITPDRYQFDKWWEKEGFNTDQPFTAHMKKRFKDEAQNKFSVAETETIIVNQDQRNYILTKTSYQFDGQIIPGYIVTLYEEVAEEYYLADAYGTTPLLHTIALAPQESLDATITSQICYSATNSLGSDPDEFYPGLKGYALFKEEDVREAASDKSILYDGNNYQLLSEGGGDTVAIDQHDRVLSRKIHNAAICEIGDENQIYLHQPGTSEIDETETSWKDIRRCDDLEIEEGGKILTKPTGANVNHTSSDEFSRAIEKYGLKWHAQYNLNPFMQMANHAIILSYFSITDQIIPYAFSTQSKLRYKEHKGRRYGMAIESNIRVNASSSEFDERTNVAKNITIEIPGEIVTVWEVTPQGNVIQGMYASKPELTKILPNPKLYIEEKYKKELGLKNSTADRNSLPLVKSPILAKISLRKQIEEQNNLIEAENRKNTNALLAQALRFFMPTLLNLSDDELEENKPAITSIQKAILTVLPLCTTNADLTVQAATATLTKELKTIADGINSLKFARYSPRLQMVIAAAVFLLGVLLIVTSAYICAQTLGTGTFFSIPLAQLGFWFLSGKAVLGIGTGLGLAAGAGWGVGGSAMMVQAYKANAKLSNIINATESVHEQVNKKIDALKSPVLAQ